MIRGRTAAVNTDFGIPWQSSCSPRLIKASGLDEAGGKPLCMRTLWSPIVRVTGQLLSQGAMQLLVRSVGRTDANCICLCYPCIMQSVCAITDDPTLIEKATQLTRLGLATKLQGSTSFALQEGSSSESVFFSPCFW